MHLIYPSCRILHKSIAAIMFTILSISCQTPTNQEVAKIGPTGEARVSIEFDKVNFDRSEPIIVHVTFENPNEFPIKILKWFTPLEGIDRSLFSIMRNGKPVRYLGKLVKRAAPSDSDYLTINAGATISCQVNLSAYYDLAIPGNYDVTYEASTIRLYAKGGQEQQLPNQIGQLRSESKSIIIK